MQTTQIEVARKPFDEMAQYTNEELLQVFLTDKLPINEQRQVLADFWKLIPDLSLFSLLYNPEKKQIFADYPELNRQFLACVELGRRIELAPQKIIGEIFWESSNWRTADSHAKTIPAGETNVALFKHKK